MRPEAGRISSQGRDRQAVDRYSELRGLRSSRCNRVDGLPGQESGSEGASLASRPSVKRGGRGCASARIASCGFAATYLGRWSQLLPGIRSDMQVVIHVTGWTTRRAGS